MSSIAHLARRFAGSLSRTEPAAPDLEWARSQLLAGEWEKWRAMAVQDRRHSIEVAQRLVARLPAVPRPVVAGALLHDVGKQLAGLGTIGRVVATMAGPRTVRFRRYHDHEQLGAAMLHDAGSDPLTVELVGGDGAWAAMLRAADDV